MASLAHSVAVQACFLDRNGEALQQASRLIAEKGRQVPFTEEGLILKAGVPLGAEFQASVEVDEEEALNYRAYIPVPERLQEKVGDSFRKGRSKTRLIARQDWEANHLAGENFTADVWHRIYVAQHGFVEVEFHVGEEGTGTPKWVAKSQFWVKVKE